MDIKVLTSIIPLPSARTVTIQVGVFVKLMWLKRLPTLAGGVLYQGYAVKLWWSVALNMEKLFLLQAGGESGFANGIYWEKDEKNEHGDWRKDERNTWDDAWLSERPLTWDKRPDSSACTCLHQPDSWYQNKQTNTWFLCGFTSNTASGWSHYDDMKIRWLNMMAEQMTG